MAGCGINIKSRRDAGYEKKKNKQLSLADFKLGEFEHPTISISNAFLLKRFFFQSFPSGYFEPRYFELFFVSLEGFNCIDGANLCLGGIGRDVLISNGGLWDSFQVLGGKRDLKSLFWTFVWCTVHVSQNEI